MKGPKERERGRGPEGPSFAKRTPLPDPSGPLGPLTLRTRWRGSGYERAQRIQPRLTPTPRVQGCARGANRVRSRVRGVVGPCPHPPGVRGRTLLFGYCHSTYQLSYSSVIRCRRSYTLLVTLCPVSARPIKFGVPGPVPFAAVCAASVQRKHGRRRPAYSLCLQTGKICLRNINHHQS